MCMCFVYVNVTYVFSQMEKKEAKRKKIFWGVEESVCEWEGAKRKREK